MTDSELRVGGKRERLVAAALAVFYAHGVETTTLAGIAQAAGIPVGNVYYYFKAKSDIVAAVIDAHAQQIRAQLAAIEAAHAAPQERLKALFAAMTGESGQIAQYGCPLGSLCQEVSKHEEGEQAPDATSLVRLPLDWCEHQFRAMGRSDAADLAVQVFAAYQGAALLTSALRDPGLLERESRRIAAWVDSLLRREAIPVSSDPSGSRPRDSRGRAPWRQCHQEARCHRRNRPGCTTTRSGRPPRRPRRPTSRRSRSTCSG